MKHVFFVLLLFRTFATMNSFQQSIRRLKPLHRNAAVYTQCKRVLSSSYKRIAFQSFPTTTRWQSVRQSMEYGSGPRRTMMFSSRIDKETDTINDLIDDPDIDADMDMDGEDEPERFDYTSTRHQQKSDDEDFFDDAEMDANRINYPKGTPDGFYVTEKFTIPEGGFENLVTNTDGSEGVGITQEEVDRLGISGANITLPIALMLLDAEAYPSLSRARKSCR